MKKPVESTPERSLSEILEDKRNRRDALMLAVSHASLSELEEAALLLKEVMKKNLGARRQRIPLKFARQRKYDSSSLSSRSVDCARSIGNAKGPSEHLFHGLSSMGTALDARDLCENLEV